MIDNAPEERNRGITINVAHIGKKTLLKVLIQPGESLS